MKQIFKGYLVSKDGRVFSIKQGKLKQLKPAIHNGYKRVGLHVDEAKKQFFVHRLVAMCYLENESGYGQINHKNGVKLDNRVENLEWVTAKQNVQHSIKTGLRGSLKGKRWKVTGGQIMEIELLTYYELSTIEIGRIVGLSHTTVWRIQKELRGIE